MADTKVMFSFAELMKQDEKGEGKLEEFLGHFDHYRSDCGPVVPFFTKAEIRHNDGTVLEAQRNETETLAENFRKHLEEEYGEKIECETSAEPAGKIPQGSRAPHICSLVKVFEKLEKKDQELAEAWKIVLTVEVSREPEDECEELSSDTRIDEMRRMILTEGKRRFVFKYFDNCYKVFADSGEKENLLKMVKQIAGRVTAVTGRKGYEVISLHPHFGYDRFMEDMVSAPVHTNGKVGSYITQPVRLDGVFKDFCGRIAADQNTKDLLYVLLLEDIDSVNLRSLFGEAYGYLDQRFVGEKYRVHTMYQDLMKYDCKSLAIESRDTFAEGFYIPENLVIIMTTRDNSSRGLEEAGFVWLDWREPRKK